MKTITMPEENKSRLNSLSSRDLAMSSRNGSAFGSQELYRRNTMAHIVMANNTSYQIDRTVSSSHKRISDAEASKNDIYKSDSATKHYDDGDDDEELRKKRRKKSVAKFLCTNIGLVLAVCLYVVGGAFLFQLLEQHTDTEKCQTGEGEMSQLITTYRSELFNYIYFNVTLNPWLPVDNTSSTYVAKDGPDVYNVVLNNMINDFRDQIFSIKDDYNYNGQDCERNSLWNIQSALLFAVTIVTTIGYGHKSPATWEGQIVCICYSVLGIPIFLMAIANLSTILGDMFRFIYTNIFCFPCKTCINKTNKKKIRKENHDENISGVIDSNENNNQTKSNIEYDANGNEIVDEEENVESLISTRVSVPLIVVLLVLAIYITFGGFLFSKLEDWSTLSSCYFSFVSLSTIGFGDYIPGLAKLQSDSEIDIGSRDLLIATVYIFFGMAILAMCFDLMQESLVDKFSLIGEKLGISASNGEEEDAENETVDDLNEDISKDYLPPEIDTEQDLKLSNDFKINPYTNDDYMEKQALHSASRIQLSARSLNKSPILVRPYDESKC